ncbi:elongation factor TS-domain-containing protein [Spinellus fusiger]|nr:elongation factor TS-domain-containing protein [Spinellus fusiger]
MNLLTSIKPNIKLLAKLRQETEVSMTKAKEALVKNDNDYTKALAWLATDAQVSGAKKAQKVAGRTASEGLVTIATVHNKSTIIELNCETDFVSRNDVFKTLASRIAATSLFLHDTAATGKAIETVSVESLLQAPLMPLANEPTTEDVRTVQETIVETIGKLGENISLRRAAVVVDGISSAYVHGGDATSGKMGGIAVLQPHNARGENLTETAREALSKAARQVARQVVGYSPLYVSRQEVPAKVLEEQTHAEEYITSTVLEEQGFMLRPDATVAVFVDTTGKEAGVEGARVAEFIRWQVGEGIEKKESDFAEEVRRTIVGN